jgi:hypothetical protein
VGHRHYTGARSVSARALLRAGEQIPIEPENTARPAAAIEAIERAAPAGPEQTPPKMPGGHWRGRIGYYTEPSTS